jgi:ankyrin repeat protein
LVIIFLKGDEKSVRFLLEKSIAHGKQTLLLSSRDSHCNSPLHLACIHNHIQIARLLIEFGADLTQRNMHDQTPFHVCCDNSSLSILKCLFEAASQQSLNVHVDWEMMQLAIRKDDSQMFAFLSSNDLSYLFKDNERVEMHDFFDLAFKTKSNLI